VGRDGGQGGVSDAMHSNSGIARVPTGMDEAEGKVSLLAAVANRFFRGGQAPPRPDLSSTTIRDFVPTRAFDSAHRVAFRSTINSPASI
jgi:hypothetical protein